MEGMGQRSGEWHDLVFVFTRLFHLLYGKQTISQKEWKQRPVRMLLQ